MPSKQEHFPVLLLRALFCCPATMQQCVAAAQLCAPLRAVVQPRSQRPQRRAMPVSCTAAPPQPKVQRPDKTGRYGQFGGRYVPETLILALDELTAAYEEAINDPAFQVSRIGCIAGMQRAAHAPPPHPLHHSPQAELDHLLKHYVGRESPLYHAERLSERYRRCAWRQAAGCRREPPPLLPPPATGRGPLAAVTRCPACQPQQPRSCSLRRPPPPCPPLPALSHLTCAGPTAAAPRSISSARI